MRQQFGDTLIELFFLGCGQFGAKFLDEFETAENNGVISCSLQTLGIVLECLELIVEDLVEIKGGIEIGDECKQREPLLIIDGIDGHFEQVELVPLITQQPEVEEVACESPRVFVLAEC